MRNNYLLILLMIFVACSNENNKQAEKTYVANRDFGIVENHISKRVLDSLIATSKEIEISEYNSKDPLINSALEILFIEMKNINADSAKLLVSKVIKDNDSTVTFVLSHFDYLVYMYNLKMKNLEFEKHPYPDGSYEVIPPITGNISGFEGWYSVDLKNRTLKISYAQ